jgi:hypothetical protein
VPAVTVVTDSRVAVQGVQELSRCQHRQLVTEGEQMTITGDDHRPRRLGQRKKVFVARILGAHRRWFFRIGKDPRLSADPCHQPGRQCFGDALAELRIGECSVKLVQEKGGDDQIEAEHYGSDELSETGDPEAQLRSAGAPVQASGETFGPYDLGDSLTLPTGLVPQPRSTGPQPFCLNSVDGVYFADPSADAFEEDTDDPEYIALDPVGQEEE